MRAKSSKILSLCSRLEAQVGTALGENCDVKLSSGLSEI